MNKRIYTGTERLDGYTSLWYDDVITGSTKFLGDYPKDLRHWSMDEFLKIINFALNKGES